MDENNEENQDFIYVDGRKLYLHEDTKEIVATITFPDYPHIKEKIPLKINGKINGFWVDENNQQLTQTKNVFYGEKVKIKLITINVSDGREIEVEIKAKQEDKVIYLKEDKNTLKFKIKVKNGEAISEPFYLNPEWYNEEIEKYNYINHQTKIDLDKALTFVFEAKFTDGKRIYKLPREDNDKLKPVTYRRNYEELIGLFNTDNSGNKDKEQNYENKFIDSNSEIKTIVYELIEKVTNQDTTISKIKSLVEEKAKSLWDSAVKQVQSGNLDDRPLYWARNKMQTWLKRNPLFKDQIDFDKSLVKKGTELDNIITLFEENSRNYTGIDFSKAGNKKRVLITGFDPFQLGFKFYGESGIQTFNPSGIIALALNNSKELLKNNIYIQTCIFPVRYEDFDNQIVEKVVKKHINNQLSLLMTTSLNGGNPRFDIEKYATEYRGGFHDNMCVGDYNNPKYDKSRFLANESSKLTETTLPKKKIFGASDNIEVNGQNIYFDTEKSETTGSGSNYLSNEVMFRATKVRGALDIPVGHFHLGNLKTKDPKTGETKSDILKSKKIENIVIEIIKRYYYEDKFINYFIYLFPI